MKNRYKKFRGFILVFLITLVAVSCSINSSVDSEYIILQNATIIDGTGNPPIDNGVIVIKGNKLSNKNK